MNFIPFFILLHNAMHSPNRPKQPVLYTYARRKQVTQGEEQAQESMRAEKLAWDTV